MPLTAGLGFKPQHLDEALVASADGLWFEVHAENYMVAGGPRLAALDRLRRRHPISLHCVGFSIASVGAPDPTHLERLRALVLAIKPAFVSDHLSWQSWRGLHMHSFLPFPRTREALDRVAANVARIQDAIGMQMLLENPALYVDPAGHAFSEVEFLSELVRRTGCGLLVDVNNVFVSAANLHYDPAAYLDALPAAAVAEIHLAGHALDGDGTSGLIIDSHDSAVSEAVWALYTRLIHRIGPRPTLIERDDNIPPFPALMAERDRAHAELKALAAHKDGDRVVA